MLRNCPEYELTELRGKSGAGCRVLPDAKLLTSSEEDIQSPQLLFIEDIVAVAPETVNLFEWIAKNCWSLFVLFLQSSRIACV